MLISLTFPDLDSCFGWQKGRDQRAICILHRRLRAPPLQGRSPRRRTNAATACQDCTRRGTASLPGQRALAVRSRAKPSSGTHSAEKKHNDSPQHLEEQPGLSTSPPVKEDSISVRAALLALGFYRTVISPLMPNSCRYLPTCSEYSQRAYREFGGPKGTVMTAWRLLRCNPWGGRGYDPPQWPPPGLESIFRA